MEISVQRHEILGNMSEDGYLPMEISNEDLQFIIGSLTNIYPNKRLAILREYASNAYDAQLEADEKNPDFDHTTGRLSHPIEITLPSAFNPNIVFTDFGTGMGEHELNNVYRHYGKSTKRKRKQAIGAYGLGSKSALTLVESFHLTSVKDGIKYTAKINKDKEGVGRLKISRTEKTNEPNGTTIVIPAGGADEFANLAKTFFLTWKPGTVLVNGSEPASIHNSDYKPVGEFGYVKTKNARNYGYQNTLNIKIAMGPIIYNVGELPHTLSTEVFGDRWNGKNSNMRNFEYILTAGMGDVELVPSREEVAMGDKTNGFIKKQLASLVNEYKKQLSNSIYNAPTRMEAVKTLEDAVFFSRADYKWQGEEIPETVPTLWNHYHFNKSNGRKFKYADAANVKVSAKDKVLFINTADSTVEMTTIMRHLKTWAKVENFTLTDVYIGAMPEAVNPWLKAMIEEKTIVVETAVDIAEKAKAFNRENRKSKATGASSGPRDTMTYPTYVLDAENKVVSEPLTIDDIRDLTEDVYYVDSFNGMSGLRGIDPVVFHNSERNAIKVALEKYLKPKARLIIISHSRKAESFLKRVEGEIKVTEATAFIEKKIRKALAEKVEVANEIATKIEGDYESRKFFKNFVGKETESTVFNGIIKAINDGTANADVKVLYAEANTLVGFAPGTCDKIRYGDSTTQTLNVYNRFLAHFPMVAMVLSGSRYGTHKVDGDIVDSLIVYINSVTASKGEFSL